VHEYKSERYRIRGIYVSKSTRHVSKHWAQVCKDHEMEFPQINYCTPGTFNVRITQEEIYVPPGDEDYRKKAKERGRTVGRYQHGNYLSPRSKVVEINNKPVEAWIYCGGNPDNRVIELISQKKLSEYLGIENEDTISILVEHVPEETADMPLPPPDTPGETVCKPWY